MKGYRIIFTGRSWKPRHLICLEPGNGVANRAEKAIRPVANLITGRHQFGVRSPQLNCAKRIFDR
jgi:hypothetical protein